MAKQYLLSENDRDAIQEVLNWFRSQAQAAALGNPPPAPRSINGLAQLAKLQNPYQPSNGVLSVKLLKKDGTERDKAFNIYAFTDQAANDVDDYISSPTIEAAALVLVTRAADGKWYLKAPALIAKGSSTSSVTTPIDITGSTLSSIGKW